MARKTTIALSAIERAAIAQVRVWRVSPENEFGTIPFKIPARLMKRLIVGSRGHVKLRFHPIASELGVAMRTLERAFFDRYGKTMRQCQVEERISYAKVLLSKPPTKISAIASMLGYDEERDFQRFFEKHLHESPSAWSKREYKG